VIVDDFVGKCEESMSRYHVVLLGDGGVGKSCITIQMTANTFVEEYDPTIEDVYRKQIVVDDQSCLLEILDTGGREEFSALRDESLRKAHGYIIVYSITSLSSFELVESYITQVFRVARPEAQESMILAGNKVDLHENRKVETHKGSQLAAQHGIPFYETSAKLRTNIEEIFCKLIRLIRKFEPKAPPTSKKSYCLLL